MLESSSIVVSVKVIPRSSRNEVVDRDGGLVVRVTASPVEGQANAAVIKLVAEYFDVAKSRVRIVRGLGSRQKTIAIA